ncbi:MAG: Drug/Metabolite Transporter (DMT) Superfamily [uncultured bacterium]|nr:MAG: Drug/Metabolite Transporter (DMT) Superfamily [uncultured bacterium]
MNWILFAFLGAMFQAVESAIKKKALQTKGMNNVVAFVAYLTAGISFALMYFLKDGTLLSANNLSGTFWGSLAFLVVLNIIGVWFAYKALDLAELSYLMPFMTLTSLSLIIPPMILLGEFPSRTSLLGIVVVVIGAISMEWKRGKHLSLEDLERNKNNRKGVLFFLGTALCYTFTPALAKVTIVESGSVLFASYVTHLLMAMGFVLWIFFMPIVERKKESLKIIMQNLTGSGARNFLLASIFAGIAIAISNGAINYALQFESVSSVFAIKRTMPLFAFMIGVFYFKEKRNLKQKIVATLIMVAGAIIITFSK